MRRLAPVLVLLMLAACDGGGDPVEQALRETAAANHSAVTKETATAEPSPSTDTADQIRVAGMITENRAAVTTAQTALRESQDPEIRRIAQATIETRTREIAELEAWTPAAQSADR